MLVKELLQCMHCDQTANIRIYEFDKSGVRVLYRKQEARGHLFRLEIPENVLSREVYYYHIKPNISKVEKNNREYIGDIPHFRLDIEYAICVYGGE